MFAFIHLIGAWSTGKLYEQWKKQPLEHTTWFFLLFGALLPDVDFLLDWTRGTEIHRTMTHSLLFVVVAFVLVHFIFTAMLKKPEGPHYAFALSAGIITHLLLDMIASQGVPLFWPSLVHVSFIHIGYFDPATPSFLHGSPDVLRRVMKVMILDMAAGAAWIFWLWWKKKVTF